MFSVVLDTLVGDANENSFCKKINLFQETRLKFSQAFFLEIPQIVLF